MKKLGWKQRYKLEHFATRNKLNPELYARAGGLGLSERQLDDVVSNQHDLHGFIESVGEGSDPDDLLELVRSRPLQMLQKINFTTYPELTDRGLVHSQILRLVRRGASLENIKEAIDSGATAQEYGDWVKQLGSYSGVQKQHDAYFTGRRLGLSHTQAVNALYSLGPNTDLKGAFEEIARNPVSEQPEQQVARPKLEESEIDPRSRSMAVQNARSTGGITVDQLNEAHELGVLNPPGLYSVLRKDHSHEEALKKALDFKNLSSK